MIIGIDPGVSGAIATSEGWVESLPIIGAARKRRLDAVALRMLIHPFKDQVELAILEKQSPRPGEGRVSGGTTMLIYGSLYTFLELEGIPFEEVHASRWRPQIVGRGTDKNASVAKALNLFPGVRASLVGPRGGKDHNRAEALLLAEYGRRLRHASQEAT